MNGTVASKRKVHAASTHKSAAEPQETQELHLLEPSHPEAVHAEQEEQVISVFRGAALQRRMAQLGFLELQLREQGLAADYDQKPWSLLYKALIDSIGADPRNFQLIYPFTSWNWPTQQSGFISSAQYNFCGAVPQWSAVG